MKIIGITGGSGGGKSTVTKIIEKYDAEILDADIVAKEVVEPGKPAFLEIKDEWPSVVLDGVLDRKALAKIVFNNADDLHKLNTITHKYVIEEIKNKINNSQAAIFVIDAIALFESGLADFCDVTICVIAKKEERIKRIMKRDNLTELEATERINAQKNDSFYIERSDFVIYNNEGQHNLEEEIGRIIKGS